MKIKCFLRTPILPSELTPQNIRYDFNDGCRVQIPDVPGEYTVTMTDLDSGLTLERATLHHGGQFAGRHKFYIRHRLDIDRDGQRIFTHEMNLEGKEVLLDIESDALGDNIAWFSYAERFQRKHGCKLGVAMNPKIAEIFRETHPQIAFFTREEAKRLAPYATYRLGVRYGSDGTRQRMDYRQVPLDALAGYDLGMDDEIRPQPPMPHTPKTDAGKVSEPHVCLAFRASMAQKEWQREGGWDEVVAHIKARGFRAICIDRDAKSRLHGAEDFTGDRPLDERINTLVNARLFVGLPSGLTWLAWTTLTPIVMISGFTEPWAEMPCIRVQNHLVCHGCWNEAGSQFTCGKADWCPHGKAHECTKAITPKMVIEAINKELGDRR